MTAEVLQGDVLPTLPVEMAKKVIEQPPRWWRREHGTKPRPKDCPGQRKLF